MELTLKQKTLLRYLIEGELDYTSELSINDIDELQSRIELLILKQKFSEY